ncbi:MAG: 4-hydroxy-tetrahydrodipicolinate synthase [Candidatus Eremiobacteraeota bacterium]|nr:4-hydroxy-tetrahydrodipicolinate synthase [Candidatus Eremiobacteraeota bacterium]
MNLGTILTAMITPFNADGQLDEKEARRIASWLVERGNDGLVVAGSTGEGQTLNGDERRRLFAAVKAELSGRAAVIANAGSNDTRASVGYCEEAQAAGADAILAVVPYYNKPTQSGMLAHFGALAQATSLPIIVYNIPGRTGVNMLPETLLQLARRHKNIAGVKESSGDLKQQAMILKDRPSGFGFWCGDDHLFLPGLAIGADGVVGVASHLCSREYRAMFDAFQSGNVAEATRIHLSLLPLIDALFSTTNPIAVKWAMNKLGFATGACRLPLDSMPRSVIEQLEPLLERFADAAAV